MNNLLEGSGYLESDITATVARLRMLADDLESLSRVVNLPEPQVTVSHWLIGRRAVPCLIGKVRGHPTVTGNIAATTEVFFLNQMAGLARTSSRWYRLGRAAGHGEFL